MWHPPSAIAGKGQSYNVRIGLMGLLLISLLNEVKPISAPVSPSYLVPTLPFTYDTTQADRFRPVLKGGGAIKADIHLDLVALFRPHMQRVPLDPKVQIPKETGVVEIYEKSGENPSNLLSLDSILENRSEDPPQLWVPKRDLSSVLRVMLGNPEHISIRKGPNKAVSLER